MRRELVRRKLRAIVLMESFEHLCRRFAGVSTRIGVWDNPVALAATPRSEGAVFKPDGGSGHGEFYSQIPASLKRFFWQNFDSECYM